ncbi:hypothetical protein QWA_17430 [Alcaligenes faecalis subsp. faecalis NCIB 8687]|nr:hypothetical protein QWA_17430 [Alcaligenes faecalis subsp. faecalis NCIB 8687]
MEKYERWMATEAGMELAEGEKAPSPMFTPFKLRDMQLKGVNMGEGAFSPSASSMPASVATAQA